MARVKQFLKRKEVAVLGILVLLCILLTILSPVFLTVENILDVLKGNVVVGIMALGMLPVIITAGMDVSVSAIIALCSTVTGKILSTMETNLVVIFIISVAIGVACGLINGLIISKLKIPPIVTTLGTQAIILGAVLLWTNGNWITGMPAWFEDFGFIKLLPFELETGAVGGIGIQIVIWILCCILTWFILRYTLIGRSVYAYGGNVNSALRVGYKPTKTILFTYAFCGFMAGIASVTHTSIVQNVDPGIFQGEEMTVISIVVIGGASIMGGSGSVFGTVVGTILWGVIGNGLILAKVPTFWQQIVMGIIILLAVSIDVINRKAQARKLVRVDVEE